MTDFLCTIRVKNESTAVCGVLAVEPADSCIDLDLPESTADLRVGIFFSFIELLFNSKYE